MFAALNDKSIFAEEFLLPWDLSLVAVDMDSPTGMNVAATASWDFDFLTIRNLPSETSWLNQHFDFVHDETPDAAAEIQNIDLVAAVETIIAAVDTLDVSRPAFVATDGFEPEITTLPAFADLEDALSVTPLVLTPVETDTPQVLLEPANDLLAEMVSPADALAEVSNDDTGATDDTTPVSEELSVFEPYIYWEGEHIAIAPEDPDGFGI